MSNLLIVILSMFCLSAFGGTSVDLQPEQPARVAPLLIAMGPDPGGHTGAGVTPETTKTGRPEVDAARTTASGGKVENNSPPNPVQSKASDATAKPAN